MTSSINVSLIILLAIVVIFITYCIKIYNNLITLRNRYKNAFSQIDVQLQRRYDLIPNLVETAKAYLKHERETLTQVIEARNQALNAKIAVSQDLANTASMQTLINAESNLTSSLGKLLAISENYPDLKANTTMIELMEELKTTENRVAFSRQAYNDSVMSYNTAIQEFPDFIIANFANFKEAAFLTIANAEAKDAVKVSF